MFGIIRRALVAISQLVERGFGGREVADSRFDSRTGNVLLRPWERHCAYFPMRPSSLIVVVAQADKRLANGTQKKVLYVGVV